MLPVYSWVWGPPLDRRWLPRAYNLKENCLSLSQQLSTASSSCTGVEICAYTLPHPPPALGWNLVWFGLAQSQPLCVHTCSCPAMPGRHCFLVAIHCLRLLHSFHSPLQLSLSFGCVCDIDVPFRNDHSTVSYSVYLEQLWASVLITASRTFSDEVWDLHESMSIIDH